MEWAKVVSWQEPRQVEQDLIITKALMKIYGHKGLKETLAFRGGTALNKLFFHPPSRYSEDIDLVKISPGPIGTIIDDLRSVMDDWFGEPKRSFSTNLVTLTYKTTSDDGFPIRLKLEINTSEHFSVFGLQNYIFKSLSSFTPGEVEITTFAIEELLATKLRALYQRRKGRDLYDLYMALTTIINLDCDELLEAFHKYLAFGGDKISKKLFIENMESKMKNKEFLYDMDPLLPLGRKSFDAEVAYEMVLASLISKI